MVQHLLIPLDGSRLAEAVLPGALELARRCNARLTLLHILELGAPAKVHGVRHLREQAEAERYLNETAARLDFPRERLAVEVHPTREGDVARSIFQHAAELQADLVVLSTHGRMGLREWIFGSIAQKVLRRGAAPVFMLQPTPAGAAPEFRPERAVVYLEGTAADQAVLAAAEGLAAQCGTSLHLLMCVPTRDTLAAQHAPTGTLLPTAMAAVLDLAERGAAEQLQTYVTHLQDRQIAASAQVVRGDALQKLIETARQRSTDLICLTTHGESGLAALGTEEVAPKILPKFNGAFLLIRAEE